MPRSKLRYNITILPSAMDRITPEQLFEMALVEVRENHRLYEAKRSQIILLLQSCEPHFEANEYALRMHFTERLRIIARLGRFTPDQLEYMIGQDHLGDLNWEQIDQLIGYILEKGLALYGAKEVHPDGRGKREECEEIPSAYQRLASYFGFPKDAWDELMDMVDRGKARDKLRTSLGKR